MGCWTETCVLSKLPIEDYEVCYMLTGSNILTMLFDTDDTKFIVRPPYDLNIHLGVYNSYGTLEDVEYKENSFFVNVTVWNWLLSKYETLVGANCHSQTKQYYQEQFEYISKYCRIHLNYLEDYIKISYVCTRLRLCPNSLNVQGSQDINYYLYKEWLKMLMTTNNKKIKQYEEL
jgi:hypothetical protein